MENQLPKNWIECKIDDIAEVTAGIGFPHHYQGNFDEKIPFYKVGDISQSILRNEIYLNNANNYISEEVRKQLKGKLFPIGTLVFAKIGEALRLNRRAIISKPSLCDNNVMGIIPNDLKMHKLIYYYFCTLDLGEFSAGNSIPSIRKSSVLEIPFPLAPIAEQNRIVAKLDTLFAQLETIKKSMANIPLLLKDFRHQVLTQAVTGKLTKEWRVGKKMNKWEQVQLSSVLPKGGIFDGPFGSNLKSEDYTETGVRVIRLENIEHLYFIADKQTYVSNYKHEQLIRHTVMEGDIIFSSFVSENIRACILPKLDTKAIAKADCFCIRPDKEIIDVKFLLYVLVSKYSYLQLVSKIHGATRPRINTTQLKGITIPFVPLQEQQEIVDRVQTLFAKADAIDQQYQSLKQKIDNLPQALLHKAFKGELTQQLDSDGDARELLKQIQDLKEFVSKKVKDKVLTKKVKA